MRGYLGQTRSRKLIARLDEAGWGEICQPGEFPPRRTRHGWALDNGAFAAWKAGATLDEEAFRSAARKAAKHDPPPAWVAVPDLVARGVESLAYSMGWVAELAALGLPLALVVQDGMAVQDVTPHLGAFVALFVGGSLAWKLGTACAWVGLAHEHGLACHVGRVGTGKRAEWARRIGVDSVDSCTPLWSDDNLRRWEVGMAASRQIELFAAVEVKS